MEPVLTRDAQKLVAAAYKVYLERRESGMDKLNAKYFSVQHLKNDYFNECAFRDYIETVHEMCRAFGCKAYINGSFQLNDATISYMENRFKNSVKDALSFLAQFIP